VYGICVPDPDTTESMDLVTDRGFGYGSRIWIKKGKITHREEKRRKNFIKVFTVLFRGPKASPVVESYLQFVSEQN
jgi:hypothetical protein